MIIHANVYNPKKALFKDTNDRAECQTINCSNSENCDLYKRQQCAIRNGLYRTPCPYGKWITEEGYTKRARKFSSWIAERKEKYKDVGFLKAATKLGIVGEYVFLPYDYIGGTQGLGLKNNIFIKLEEFTEEYIIDICERRPLDMMGGEIKSYQKEIVPLFLIHLKEIMPDIYRKLSEIWLPAKKIVENYSNVGRKALLSSIRPNGPAFVDCHGGEWIWDGTYLTMTNRQSALTFVKSCEQRLKPYPDVVVKISSDEQVDENTIFVD
jgi:hypothetical protein